MNDDLIDKIVSCLGLDEDFKIPEVNQHDGRFKLIGRRIGKDGFFQ